MKLLKTQKTERKSPEASKNKQNKSSILTKTARLWRITSASAVTEGPSGAAGWPPGESSRTAAALESSGCRRGVRRSDGRRGLQQVPQVGWYLMAAPHPSTLID